MNSPSLGFTNSFRTDYPFLKFLPRIILNLFLNTLKTSLILKALFPTSWSGSWGLMKEKQESSPFLSSIRPLATYTLFLDQSFVIEQYSINRSRCSERVQYLPLLCISRKQTSSMQNNRKLPRPPEQVYPRLRILSIHLSTMARYLNQGKQSTIFLTSDNWLMPSSLLTDRSNCIQPQVLMNLMRGTFDFLMQSTSQYSSPFLRMAEQIAQQTFRSSCPSIITATSISPSGRYSPVANDPNACTSQSPTVCLISFVRLYKLDGYSAKAFYLNQCSTLVGETYSQNSMISLWNRSNESLMSLVREVIQGATCCFVAFYGYLATVNLIISQSQSYFYQLSTRLTTLLSFFLRFWKNFSVSACSKGQVRFIVPNMYIAIADKLIKVLTYRNIQAIYDRCTNK